MAQHPENDGTLVQRRLGPETGERDDPSTQWAQPRPMGVDLVQRNRLLQQVEASLFSRPTLPPSVILKSRYQLTALLGSGGMGVVYSAYDPVLERDVAIKFVRTGSAVATRDLLREARTLARLRHPNVVPVYDVGEYDPREFEALGLAQGDGLEPTFVVMERVEGTTLNRWLDYPKRPLQEIVAVFVQAAEGLAAAHEVGVVHRDFKPSNVMVSDAGRARVLDFGLARRVGDGVPSQAGGLPVGEFTEFDAERTLVETGMAIGTPAYMAPEQHVGEHGDARSDQYSFCVALCEALTREPLFRARSPSEIARDKARGPVTVSSSANVPRRIRALIRRGTAPDPAARFSSMDAVVAELRPVLRGRRRWFWVGGASFLGGTALASSLSPSPDRDCQAEAAEAIESTWNATKRDELQGAFFRADVPFAATSWASTQEELDGFAQRWVDRRASACQVEAANEPSSTSTTECLDNQRDYMTALVQVLQRGDTAVVASAVSLMELLPHLDDCDSALRRPAHRVGSSTQAIAEAKVRETAGDVSAAQELLTTELQQHEDTLSSSSAALLLARAGVALRAGEPATAETDANRAWEIAERSGDSQLASRAMVAIVSVRRAQARYAEAESMLSILSARASAAQEGSTLSARVLTERGQLAWTRNDFTAAVSSLQEAMDAWVVAQGPNAQPLAGLRSTHAVAVARMGATDTAISLIEELYEEQRSRLGEGHPSLATIDLDFARIHRAARRPRLALRHLRTAVGILKRSGMQARLEKVDALESAAAVELDLGLAISAEDTALELIADQRQRLGEGHPQLVDAYSTLALARSLRGNPRASAEALGLAEKAHDASPEPSPVVGGLIEALLCDAQMQLGETDEAIELCGAAVTAWSTATPENSTTALLRMMFAVALGRGGRTSEALVQVDAAREVLDDPSVPTIARAQGAMLEGELWFSAGQLGLAMVRFEEARSMLEPDPSGAPAEWVRIQLRRATIAGMHGDRERAMQYARLGTAYARQVGLEVEIAAACTKLLAVVTRPVDRRRSRALHREAKAQFKRLGTDPVVIANHARWSDAVASSLR
jgi:serine/threonine protein kinase/tetratricopeptide (TPR) repeat protein